MEIIDVKDTNDCIEVAEMDSHSEDEAVSGWHECLSQAFNKIEDILLFGHPVKFCGVELQGNQVLANVKYNNRNALVSLSSINFISPEKYMEIWKKAYIKSCI